MRLVINLITRNRPKLLVETVRETLDNMRDPSTGLMISVDRDDAETVDTLLGTNLHKFMDICDREDSLGEKWNRALQWEADDRVFLPMCDDSPMQTPGFDKSILEAASLFPDGIGMVYNHLANASFPTINAITAKFARYMGGIFPEYFPYWFVDHWTDDIARLIGRIAFADVKVGQTARPGTMEMREPAFWATFFDAGYLERRRVAHRIIDELEEPDWRKQILRTHHPLIEFRSKWINDNVRAMAPHMQAASAESGGERYTRIKARAVAKMREWVSEIEAEEKQAA